MSVGNDADWDDSSLVESWNQALDEYKKYHSVHAAGGTVEDLIKDEEEKTPWDDAKPETNHHADGSLGYDEVKINVEEEAAEATMAPRTDETGRTAAIISNPPHAGSSADAIKSDDFNTSQASQTGQQGGNGPPAAAFMPPPFLGAVHDEELKALLMSWYWAGFYTGRLQGKKEGLQEAEQARQGPL
ncbi:hypothetical protein B0H63DRAFT_143212 [Podospora didyma]|uniref:Survival motor neuron Tudor domain-containing protein n=1 Tax=Podospora didyma TaxID=330526 RepID=A0AAE0NSX3_9PEZI|nr:hypothetical protein B0H63DRAFT_143212 [Podospora didyma]